MKVKKHKDRIIKLLTDKPHLREDDQPLIANIWWTDIKNLGLDPNNITGTKVLELFSQDKLSHPESIMRARRKIQEEMPELRGKNRSYKNAEQDQVKDELKNWNE